MSPAKPKPKQSDERRTVEEARRAFADRTAAMTAGYVFRLRYAWEAVAIGLPAIEALRLAEKSWNEIAAQLAAASGFPTISGQSVRVYRSRLKSDFYDAQLGRLGLRREGKVLLPLVAEDKPRGDEEASDRLPERYAAAQSEPATELLRDTTHDAPGSAIGACATQPSPGTNDGSHAIVPSAVAVGPALPTVATAQAKPPVPETLALIRFKPDPE